MIHISGETETLARRVAAKRGVSVEDAVKRALEESARDTDHRPAIDGTLTREELIRRMEEISARSAARPIVDPRSADELIGYDDYGLPR